MCTTDGFRPQQRVPLSNILIENFFLSYAVHISGYFCVSCTLGCHFYLFLAILSCYFSRLPNIISNPMVVSFMIIIPPLFIFAGNFLVFYLQLLGSILLYYRRKWGLVSRAIFYIFWGSLTKLHYWNLFNYIFSNNWVKNFIPFFFILWELIRLELKLFDLNHLTWDNQELEHGNTSWIINGKNIWKS